MKLLLATILIFIASPSFSDELQIPYSCWANDISKEFANKGIKVDVTPLERTKDSWGYIECKGTRYSIFSYNPIKQEEFELIKEIVIKVEMANGENNSP